MYIRTYVQYIVHTLSLELQHFVYTLNIEVTSTVLQLSCVDGALHTHTHNLSHEYVRTMLKGGEVWFW